MQYNRRGVRAAVAGSVSRAALSVEVEGAGTAPLELKRHLAPGTVGLIVRSVPITGRSRALDAAVSAGAAAVHIRTGLRAGGERQRAEFAAGDVAFMPAGGSICFFTRGGKTGAPLTPIGTMGRHGAALFEGAAHGSAVTIRP